MNISIMVGVFRIVVVCHSVCQPIEKFIFLITCISVERICIKLSLNISDTVENDCGVQHSLSLIVIVVNLLTKSTFVTCFDNFDLCAQILV